MSYLFIEESNIDADAWMYHFSDAEFVECAGIEVIDQEVLEEAQC